MNRDGIGNIMKSKRSAISNLVRNRTESVPANKSLQLSFELEDAQN
jgi:hypothetical protein